MHKRDYFLAALKAECYRYKKWVINAFSITTDHDAEPQLPGMYPYQLYRDEISYFFLDTDGEQVRLEGTHPKEAPFLFREQIVLGVGDVPNLKRNITSTYGNLLFNQMVLCYAFGDKIEYQEGSVSVKKIEKLIEKMLVSDPEPGQTVEPGKITVSEYKLFNDAIFSLAGFTQLCVPSATERTMTTDPRIAERRKELLEKYKDRLHDPVVQAMIDKELIAMDREWINGDPLKGFYYKDKSFNVVRKKIFLLQGAESGFGLQGELIPRSLEEGWDIQYLPAMSNALRDGSYNRGSQTMLGGEATKFNYRIFQNSSVAEEDCGTTLGLEVKLTASNISHYIASYVITPEGPVEITDENKDTFVGKTVRMRSPIYCKTGGVNFCARCMGSRVAATPRAIPTYAADIGSLFMSLFMKAMHGKALVTEEWDPLEAIR